MELSEERNIVLHVGQRTFRTTTSVLLRQPSSFFHGMLSGSFKTDDDGSYFIARDGESFAHILEFLTYGRICSTIRDRGLLHKLSKDAGFYLLPELGIQVKHQLAKFCGEETMEEILRHPQINTPDVFLKLKWLCAYYKEVRGVPINHAHQQVENFAFVLKHIAQQIPDPPTSADIRHIVNEFSYSELVKSDAEFSSLQKRLQKRIMDHTPAIRKICAEISDVNMREVQHSSELDAVKARLEVVGQASEADDVRRRDELERYLSQVERERQILRDKLGLAMLEHDMASVLLKRVVDDVRVALLTLEDMTSGLHEHGML